MNFIGSPWDEANIAGLLFGYISTEVLPASRDCPNR